MNGYSGLMLLGVLAFNRKLWPKKWRLNRTLPTHVRFIQRFVVAAWGIDENSDSGE